MERGDILICDDVWVTIFLKHVNNIPSHNIISIRSCLWWCCSYNILLQVCTQS